MTDILYTDGRSHDDVIAVGITDQPNGQVRLDILRKGKPTVYLYLQKAP